MKKENKKENCIDIPLSVLQDRNVAVLESISEYLCSEKNMKYSDVAKMLNRDQRTIWTACNRAKKKRTISTNKKASFNIKK